MGTLTLKGMAAAAILASLLLLTVGPVAHARPESGGAAVKSACLLDKKILKNEPGLCEPQTAGGTVAEATRSSIPSGSSSDAILWLAVAGTIALAGVGAGAAVTHRRRLRPAG